MIFPANLTPRLERSTLVQSRSSWDVEVGRHRWSFTRTRETRTVGYGGRAEASPPARIFWPIVIGCFAVVGAFGLMVAGAFATPPSPGRPDYVLSIAVPAAPPSGASGGRKHRAPSRRASLAPGTRLADTISPAALAGENDDRHIALAMRTGAFQEWRDAAGQARFLTAGPVQAEAGRQCRQMALLVRRASGNQVTSMRHCTDGALGEERTDGQAQNVGSREPPTDASASGEHTDLDQIGTR